MNKKSTLLLITIATGLMASNSSQAFDLYAETDSNSVIPTTSAPSDNSPAGKKPTKATLQPANKQADIRTRRNNERTRRHEAREERREKFREERKERRREKLNERHREERREMHDKEPTSRSNTIK